MRPASSDPYAPLLSKQTSLMALLLATIVVGGFVMVAVSMKLNGYPGNEVRWRLFPLVVRHYGVWFLWIPVLWTLAAVWAQRRSNEQVYSFTYAVGLCVALVMFANYLVAAWDPFTRPIIIRRSKAAAQTAPTDRAP